MAYLYPGEELDVFAHARNWKRYWSSHVGAFVRGDVLEVGAGIGSNTPLLLSQDVRSLLCLEPDTRLADRLRRTLATDARLRRCEVGEGTVTDLAPNRRFDAAVYIDVLEHLEDDRTELRQVAAHLKPGGALIVLAPAHQWLYTPFDRAIGHWRRYSKATLVAVSPPDLRLRRAFYLDSVGLLLSIMNRVVLKSSTPSERQITFWDRFVVPCSSFLDHITRHTIGKSVVAIWERP